MIKRTSPFDRAGHEHKNQAAQDDDEAPDATVSKRQHKTALRSSQGDRKDYARELDHLPGSRAVPNTMLPLRVKQARARSTEAAIARREKRRSSCGIVIHRDRTAYKRMGEVERAAFNSIKSNLAHATGRTWDFNRDFHWMCEGHDEVQHLNHLFRTGSAKPHPRRAYRDHEREGLA